MLGWFLVLLFISLFIFFCSPWSPLSRFKLRGGVASKLFAFALFFVQAGLVVAVACIFPVQDFVTDFFNGGNVVTDTRQYQHVADAIIAGRANLEMDYDVPSWLVEAENPYDYGNRQVMGEQTGELAYFDYAYYNGKYYSYFGILPALVLFIPFKLITGFHISTWMATLVFSIVAVAASNLLTFALLRKSPSTKLTHYLLASTVMFIATGVIQLVMNASFYHIAILCAFSCAMLGISFWLFSIRDDGTLSRLLMFAGSILVALTILARPALVLCCLLAFPIYWNHICGRAKNEDGSISLLDKRGFFACNKNALVNTALVIVPFVIVGLFAMWWNYIRFGNPLDFGALYNLTGFDMTTQKVSKIAWLKSMFFYLVGPSDLTRVFPYIRQYSWDQPTVALGFPIGEWWASSWMIIEPYFGGFLCTIPLSILLFLVFKYAKSLNRRDALGLTVVSIIVGVLICCIDSTVAVTQRYQSDFFWLFVIGILCVYMTICETSSGLTNKAKHSSERAIRARGLGGAAVFQLVCSLLVSYSCVWTFFNLCCSGRYNALAIVNPELLAAITGLFS